EVVLRLTSRATRMRAARVTPASNRRVDCPVAFTGVLVPGRGTVTAGDMAPRRPWHVQHIPTQIMMAAHPQTLYGLADSPVALAAWLIDHDVTSYGRLAKLFLDGTPYGDLTRDDILDNITLSWLTN